MADFEPISKFTPFSDPLPSREFGDEASFTQRGNAFINEASNTVKQLNDDFIPKVNTAAGIINDNLDAIHAAPGAAQVAAASAQAAASSETNAAQSESNAAASAADAQAAADRAEAITEATYEAEPGRVAARNLTGQTQVEDPVDPLDAANKRYVDAALEEIEVLEPDGANIVKDEDNKLNLSESVQETLAKAALSGLGVGSFPGELLLNRITSGTFDFIVPDINGDGSSYWIEVHIKGGGGGGGGHATLAGQAVSFHGGGEGETVVFLLLVTPGDVMPGVAGQGGNGGTTGPGGNGGTTSFGGNTAAGGTGGQNAQYNPPSSVGSSALHDAVRRYPGSVPESGLYISPGGGFTGVQSSNGAGRFGGAGARWEGSSVPSSRLVQPGILGCGGGGGGTMSTTQSYATGGKGGDGYVRIWRVK